MDPGKPSPGHIHKEAVRQAYARRQRGISARTITSAKDCGLPPKTRAMLTAAGPLPQYYLGLAGEVLLVAGRSAEGLVLLDRAIAAIDEPGVGFYLPEIYRLRGECLLALGRSV